MQKIRNRAFETFLYFVLVWVHIALIFDIYMLYLHLSDQDAKMGFIFDKIDNFVSVLR